jgi:hypothetical protein
LADTRELPSHTLGLLQPGRRWPGAEFGDVGKRKRSRLALRREPARSPLGCPTRNGRSRDGFRVGIGRLGSGRMSKS